MPLDDRGSNVVQTNSSEQETEQSVPTAVTTPLETTSLPISEETPVPDTSTQLILNSTPEPSSPTDSSPATATETLGRGQREKTQSVTLRDYLLYNASADCDSTTHYFVPTSSTLVFVIGLR